eukprot:1161812-Pelagomonas_calceolata.AAC.3
MHAVILFCLIVALCTFGIVHATKASYELEGQQARDAALSAADGLAKQLSSASRAALSLVGISARTCRLGLQAFHLVVYGTLKSLCYWTCRQQRDKGCKFSTSSFMPLSNALHQPSRILLQAAVVKMNPNWSFLESNFHVLAEELFRQVSCSGAVHFLCSANGVVSTSCLIPFLLDHWSNEDGNDDGSLALMELTLLPFGRVRASLGKPIQRNSTADIFSSEYVDEFKTWEVVEASGLHVQGPVPLINSKNLAFTFGWVASWFARFSCRNGEGQGLTWCASKLLVA